MWRCCSLWCSSTSALTSPHPNAPQHTRGSVDTDEAGTKSGERPRRSGGRPRAVGEAARSRDAPPRRDRRRAGAGVRRLGPRQCAGGRQLRDRDERVVGSGGGGRLLEVCEAPEMLHALPKALVSARLDVDELPALCGEGEVESLYTLLRRRWRLRPVQAAPRRRRRAAAARWSRGQCRAGTCLLRFLEHPAAGWRALVKQAVRLKRELAARKGGDARAIWQLSTPRPPPALQKEPPRPPSLARPSSPRRPTSTAPRVYGRGLHDQLLEENALAAPIRLVVDDSAPPARRRAALMTVGHVGATEVGSSAELATGGQPRLRVTAEGGTRTRRHSHRGRLPPCSIVARNKKSRASPASSARSSATPPLENHPREAGQLMSSQHLEGRIRRRRWRRRRRRRRRRHHGRRPRRAPPGAPTRAPADDAAAAPAAAEASAPSALATLISLAEGAPCLSLRGAAPFAVGLISGGSAHARAALTAAVRRLECADACIALPTDPSLALSLARRRRLPGVGPQRRGRRRCRRLSNGRRRRGGGADALPREDRRGRQHAIAPREPGAAQGGGNSLRGIAQREPAVVAHPLVLLEVHRLLAEHPFTLAVRRRLHALFDPAARALAFDD